MYNFTRAAITMPLRLGGLNYRNLDSWIPGLEVQDQGVDRPDYFWGLSAWLADMHLPVSSQGLSNMCVYVLILSF